MNKKSILTKEYFHKDTAYGLNDVEACLAFVRGILENTEVGDGWSIVKMHVLEDNSFFSQALIWQLGHLQDARGIDILMEKLERVGSEDRTMPSPLYPGDLPIELICLEALAKIGGTQAQVTLDAYRSNAQKHYLHASLDELAIAKKPRRCAVNFNDKDIPDALKGVRSIQQLSGAGGVVAEQSKEKIQKALDTWRGLQFNGTIEKLSGDGKKTTFKLKAKITDHIHNYLDPFCDFGIFISNPKVEYPIGRRRFADSHTYLNFPVPDGSLYDKEYTWDIKKNCIHTHFHEQVLIEEVTVNPDGKTVTVTNKPIATGVETRGNVFAKRCNSAVRGIWDNPNKQGENYYTQRAHVITPYKRIYYIAPLHEPIVNQLGLWVVDEEEHPERFFDSSGNCIDIQGVVDTLLIPLNEPKILAGCIAQYHPTGPKDPYAKKIIPKMRPNLVAVPKPDYLSPVLGARFEHSHCGNAGMQQNKDNGYSIAKDINCDGVIDKNEQALLAKHAGEVYRMNSGDFGYFGFNWLSIGCGIRSQNIHDGKSIYICVYDYGAGYDPDSGTVTLRKPQKPGTKLYIEYFYDAPPMPGKDNIKVYLHPDIE